MNEHHVISILRTCFDWQDIDIEHQISANCTAEMHLWH
ncbi:hypothetical protein VRK_19040 [Vibrio sp. MEBiC08052]|nr:hypothetical protein VRK_19040 [Vibrio sp. MEBiC08052]